MKLRASVQQIFIGLFFILAMLFSQSALAQPESYSHPELKWRTITTPHFTVSYHEGAERSARVAANIAEDVYEPITSLYKHDPGVVNIIIKDTDDYSNGGAYFFENKIEIWAPSLDFSLRGQHNWLRNVITHEYTHIVTLTAAMKFGTTFPAGYLQIFGYEQVRRPDVLYGFPNILVSYPIAGINFPFWLAEGVAQYQRPEFRYDTWDTHRDMILRSLSLDDKIFDLPALSNYGSKKGIEFEFTYNSGYALTHYLAAKYGEEKLDSLCKSLATLSTLDASDALEAVYGKPAEQIHEEWKTYLKQDYLERTEKVRANLQEGKIVAKIGYLNTNPLFSADGRSLFYTSNLGADYSAQAIVMSDVEKDSIFLQAASCANMHHETTLSELPTEPHAGGSCKVCGHHFSRDGQVLKGGVGSRLQLSADGKTLFYSKYTGTSFKIQKFNDLFIFDIEKKKETRLTHQKRLKTPAFSPDGKMFVATTEKDGTANLCEGNFLKDESAQNLRQLTSYENGEQIFSPIYQADGSRIVFALGTGNSRRLMQLDRKTQKITPLLKNFNPKSPKISVDERDPALSPDGKFLYFSSNATGIFNIYRLIFKTGKIEQLTNVVGGAFMPSVDFAGHLAYATFTSDGYKIAVMKNPKPVGTVEINYVARNPVRPFGELNSPLMPSTENTAEQNGLPSVTQAALDKLARYDDTKLKIYPEKEYEKIFTSPHVMPILRFDSYAKSKGSFLKDAWRAAKFGAAVFSQDALGQLNIGGALTIAPGSGVSGGSSGIAGLFELERDAFLTLQYSDQNILPAAMLPKLTLDIYHQTRNVEHAGTFKQGNDSTTFNVFYKLTEFDLSLDFHIPIEHWFFKASKFRITGIYSTYTSKIGSFFWQPLGRTITASSSDYFIGKSISLLWKMNLRARTANRAINPIGFLSSVRFDYENSRLQDSVGVSNSGTVIPVYRTFNIPRLTTDLHFNFPMPIHKHTFNIRSYSALNFTGGNTDFFFHNFISGLLGMRGYEFYAIGGDKATFLHFEYRFPLMENINLQFLQFYFDKIYLSGYFDMGTAWSSGGLPGINDWRKDIGMELRLEAPSYYVFPTRLFLSATYGLDKFKVALQDEFYTDDGKDYVTYGGSWMIHFGVLFEFDLLLDAAKHSFRSVMY